MSDTGLAYIGKIISIQDIPEAHSIVSATVVCGSGGKWRGVIKKDDLQVDSECLVFMPDALLPECDELRFMQRHKWRVKMCRFRGAPSEVLIVPLDTVAQSCELEVGWDITKIMGVKKYHKPVPANLQGTAIGSFPSFIPKTDEPNYQTVEEHVDMLKGTPYYITEKLDGASSTAYKYKGEFGVCSRNWELAEDKSNGYWEIAHRYNLPELLPEGIAIQWETCGPKIQTNSLGLHKIEGFAFSGYNITDRCHLTMSQMIELCEDLQFPMVKILQSGSEFDSTGLESIGEGVYENGNQREGVVIRSCGNALVHKPITFKVINLNYEK